MIFNGFVDCSPAISRFVLSPICTSPQQWTRPDRSCHALYQNLLTEVLFEASLLIEEKTRQQEISHLSCGNFSLLVVVHSLKLAGVVFNVFNLREVFLL